MELAPISSEQAETFYAAAYSIFQRGEIEKASHAFFFLSVMQPKEHKFWYALGLCEEMLGKFDKALDAHSMAIMTDVEDPYPHFHSALCYQAIGEIQNALAAIDLAIEYAEEQGGYEHLVRDAHTLRTHYLNNLY